MTQIDGSLPISTGGFFDLFLHDWQQFGELRIRFHPRMTIITGSNGAGKSTVLRLLGSHFQWERVFYGSPESGEWRKPVRTDLDDEGWHNIGSLSYRDGVQRARIRIRDVDDPLGYNIFFFERIELSGLYLSAQRNQGNYSRVLDIPATFHAPDGALNQYSGLLRNQQEGRSQIEAPFLTLKKSLMAAALLGGGGQFVEAQEMATRAWKGFNTILRQIFPSEIGFTDLLIKQGEIVVRTRTGEFLFDELSGGLAALADIAWQVHLRSLASPNEFTVLIDEPENHLHPSLQRSILPSLTSAFPRAQFVIATHSPFVASSVEDSYLFYLHYGDNGRVEAERLELANKALTADDTARELLRVDSTAPVWAEEKYQAVVGSFADQPLDAESAVQLRRELAENGLDPEFQRAMIDLVERARRRDDAE